VTRFLSEDKPPAPEQMPELAAKLLSPKLPPLPTRDPFGLALPGRKPPPKDLAKQRGGNRSLSRSNAAGKNNASGKAVSPLSGLSLTGTCILGDQRLAVINGRLYAPKETLTTDKPAVKRAANDKAAAADEPASSSYQVVEVFPYKVLLAHNGQVLELEYSNVTSGPPSSARGGPKAGGRGAGKSRGSSGKSGRSGKT
jgi:hypothetical protein